MSRCKIKGEFINNTDKRVTISDLLRQRHLLDIIKIYGIKINKLELLTNDIKQFNSTYGPFINTSILVENEFMWNIDGNLASVCGERFYSISEYRKSRDIVLRDGLDIYNLDIYSKRVEIYIKSGDKLVYDIEFLTML